MTQRASTGVSLQRGPLLSTYEQAKANGSLSVGSYEDFFAPGIARVGTGGWVVVLIDEDNDKGVKIAAKLAPAAGSLPLFESGEHAAIGNDVILRFSAGDPGKKASEVPLMVQPGLSLFYGQIVALGGDFYGVPDKPIADGATPSARRQRFHDAYNTLANGSPTECMEIIQIMRREIDAVNAALKQGLAPSTAYDQLGNDLNNAWNRATG